MEARANHLLVGAFVLGLGAALVAFTLWVAKVELGERRPAYNIFFTGSVTGLKEGSPVRYRGVLAGTVAEIRIDPDNVERVRVTIRVDREIPMKADVVASLEMLGLTGSAYVQISGGSHAAAMLTSDPDHIPEIAAKSSTLAEVFEAAPSLARGLVEIEQRLVRILSPENEQRLARTLENLHGMSERLAGAARDVGETMTLVKTTANHMDEMLGEVRQRADTMAGNVNRTLTEMTDTSQEARQLSQSLRVLSDQMAGLIKENRVPIRDFTSVGLYELSLLINEMRELATSLSRVSTQIERGPVEFLFTGTKREEEKK
jgi:phospholipid/cholesterol/gamma-HCH transport system substrate-binding protein